MKIDDPAMLGGMETQIMRSGLNYRVQFLDSLPEDHKLPLVTVLVQDMRTTQNGVVFDQAAVERLTGDWFNRGRIYEILPEDALSATEELDRSATKLFLDRVPLKMVEKAIADLRSATVAQLVESPYATNGEDEVCRLFWAWFLWGRSYQIGNEHPSETPPS